MHTFRPRALTSLSLATLATATLIAAGGAAQAAERAKPDVRVISACFSVKTGKIRIVKNVDRCRRGEDHIRWIRGADRNRGPQGEAGASGASGAVGATGAAGPVGPTGSAGAAGATGGIGPAGPIGPAGATGATGAAGTAGGVGPAGATGAIGPAGATGAVGPAGPTGATGATGDVGPAGPAGSGAMLSSSSGAAVTTTTVLGGMGNTVTVLPINGTGSVSGVSIVGGTIDATGNGIAGLAQPITGDRTLTGIDGYFTNSVAMALIGTTLGLEVQLWTSSTPNNIFAPVPGATCTLGPSLTGILAIGAVADCTTTGLAVPLTNQTQAILVVRADITAGLDMVTALSGYWSAGLKLS
ncbi:hypothetical protein KVF89_10005 [Nocardioides carbamazepini]|uniref:hypothetical protein n=1 Tax=Nocardioides carbamazepini TaxID=2854259 RepID=UPI00214A89ED|nr:hypothetical protein [Nocardioides carbamazepini]MCR1782866.1 hypothetical protein [Nocardioides carbamazepini]